MNRTIKKKTAGQHTTDGAGVRLQRVLSRPTVTDYDPFLMLDAFDTDNPEDYLKGFPWHHRGIETVTYLVHGRVEHGDSLGNRGVIRSGSCQWMTAGGGILHQEMPKPMEQAAGDVSASRMLGVQLWINLPAKDKMAPPAYHDLTPENIPVVTGDGSRTAVLSGTFRGQTGAMRPDYVDATFLDVDLNAGAVWQLPTDKEETVVLFAFCGTGSVPDGGSVAAKEAVLFGPGDTLEVQAGPEGIRFLVFTGLPLKEPVAWGGPIVMNTREELEQAFRELDEGTFIRS